MFEDNGIVNSVVHSLAPGKRSMAGDEHAGTVQRVAAIEGFDDDFAGITFVIVFDLTRVETPGTRDRTVKIVGVSGAEGRNWAAALSPGGGKKTMGVHNATDIRKSAIEDKVGRSIRARLQIAFHHFTRFERDNRDVLRFHGVVWHAGRFDDHVGARAIHAADISPSLDDQALGDELEVGGADLFLQLVEHSDL